MPRCAFLVGVRAGSGNYALLEVVHGSGVVWGEVCWHVADEGGNVVGVAVGDVGSLDWVVVAAGVVLVSA